MNLKVAVFVVGATSCVSACGVGGVSGEIDGRTVPRFSDAAFGGVESVGGTDVFALLGFALPRDSCTDGAAIGRLAADEKEARRDGDIDGLDGALQDQADLTNEVIGIGDWFTVLSFVGEDIDDVRSETFDVEDLARDEVAIALSFCLQEDEAEVFSEEGIPTIAAGAKCFSVGEGELTFELNADDTTLRVFSEDEVEVQFANGNKAGDVTVDISFSGCRELSDVIDDSING